MQKKPNLLFFGIDSLRADHMSLYGYSRLTTPHITEYLKDGVIFDRMFSPHIPTTPGTPTCSPGGTASAPRWWPCGTKGL